MNAWEVVVVPLLVICILRLERSSELSRLRSWNNVGQAQMDPYTDKAIPCLPSASLRTGNSANARPNFTSLCYWTRSRPGFCRGKPILHPPCKDHCNNARHLPQPYTLPLRRTQCLQHSCRPFSAELGAFLEATLVGLAVKSVLYYTPCAHFHLLHHVKHNMLLR